MKLKRIRSIAALAALALFISVFFTDNSAARAELFSWQLTPALLVFAASWLFLLLLALSLALCGRLYCSVWCPSGIIQEIFFRLGKAAGLAKLRYVPPFRSIVLLFAAAVFLFIGLLSLPNLLDPLGWFGRLLAPIVETAASLSEGMEFYAGYIGLAGIGPALALVLLVIIPLFKGRWFCDRACPVGMALGILGTAANRKIAIKQTECVSCRACEKECPTRAIDGRGQRVDNSRCVVCFSCLDKCPKNAIAFTSATDSESRRKALAHTGAWIAAGAYLLARGWKGTVSVLAADRKAVIPPGAGDAGRYFRSCVGCQSCVAACPVGIIKPPLPGIQPELRFNLGYCQYNCQLCSEACPSGALLPLSLEEKKITRIARTELLLERCVVITEGTACGACAEVCPTRALSMEAVPSNPDSPTQPVFYPDHCIGCGACLHVCPAEPRAFIITGLNRHELALPMREAGTAEEQTTEEPGMVDFPF